MRADEKEVLIRELLRVAREVNRLAKRTIWFVPDNWTDSVEEAERYFKKNEKNY